MRLAPAFSSLVRVIPKVLGPHALFEVGSSFGEECACPLPLSLDHAAGEVFVGEGFESP